MVAAATRGTDPDRRQGHPPERLLQSTPATTRHAGHSPASPKARTMAKAPQIRSQERQAHLSRPPLVGWGRGWGAKGTTRGPRVAKGGWRGDPRSACKIGTEIERTLRVQAPPPKATPTPPKDPKGNPTRGGDQGGGGQRRHPTSKMDARPSEARPGRRALSVGQARRNTTIYQCMGKRRFHRNGQRPCTD